MNHAKSDKQSDATKPNKQDYQALERQNRALLKELDLRKREIDFLDFFRNYLLGFEVTNTCD